MQPLKQHISRRRTVRARRKSDSIRTGGPDDTKTAPLRSSEVRRRTLGVQRRLAGLVLGDLVHGVLLARLVLAERPLVLRYVHLRQRTCWGSDGADVSMPDMCRRPTGTAGLPLILQPLQRCRLAAGRSVHTTRRQLNTASMR